MTDDLIDFYLRGLGAPLPADILDAVESGEKPACSMPGREHFDSDADWFYESTRAL